MTDSTHAKIITALGATHANVSSEALTSVYHPYASLSAAEAGSDDANHLNTADLTSGDGFNLFWPCYGATTDTAYLIVVNTAWTTSDTHSIKIFSVRGIDEKDSINNWRNNTTKWSDSFFHMVCSRTYNGVINVTSVDIEIEGIQINNTGAKGSQPFGIEGSSFSGITFKADSCFIKSTGTGTTTSGAGISTRNHKGTNVHITNNVIYDWYDGYIDGWPTGVGNNYIFNNTVVNSAHDGIVCGSVTDQNLRLANNVSQNNVNKDYIAYNVDYSASNISDDTTSPNSSFREITLTFNDASSDDYSLASTDTDALDAGVDMSAYMDAVDIIGTVRPQSTAWDIGAFEFPVAVTAGAIINQFQKANLGADLFNGSLI